ncbi:zinc finger protein 410-like [Oppia nitens]|uniref:zinc finger protein 410-like n=1 Tax=Oppia nitens TaxID=1686743 RepID=UPI0023DC7EEF|nr:zinc finger protein 410-like [Oppia nitens]
MTKIMDNNEMNNDLKEENSRLLRELSFSESFIKVLGEQRDQFIKLFNECQHCGQNQEMRQLLSKFDDKLIEMKNQFKSQLINEESDDSRDEDKTNSGQKKLRRKYRKNTQKSCNQSNTTRVHYKYHCQTCGYKTKDLTRFNRHLTNNGHQRSETMVADVINKTAEKVSDEEVDDSRLMKTSGKNTKEKKKFICNEDNCGKQFKDTYHLMRHKKTHKKSLFKCEFKDCDQSFGELNSLVNHTNTYHNFISNEILFD